MRPLLAALACAPAVVMAAPAHAQEQASRFDIPAQPLSSAVMAYSQQSDIPVVAPMELLRGKQAPAVRGTMTASEALNRLLAGSGLHAERAANGGIVLKQGESGPFAQDEARSAPAIVEEVVVTAQKREESSLKVPLSMTALTGNSLAGSQSFRLEDFAGKVPGLTLIEDGALGTQLVIRGMTTGSSAVNSSVASYIDETPYTAVGPWAGSFLVAPNLDTYDMQRVEVLRGPQGTLYGSSALGGLLKYVTNAPDPSRYAASVEAGVSSVAHGGTGGDAHAMVNLPLGEDAALRLVAYDTAYAGFIDDPSRGLNNINTARYSGGRASLLWRPSAELSLRLSALYQKRSWNDYPSEDVNPGTLAPVYGERIQERVVGQPGDRTDQLYNLTINWNPGPVSLLSTTSYADFRNKGTIDYSLEFGPLVSLILGAPLGMVDVYSPSNRAFTQEVRLSSTGESPLRWQFGGFYTRQTGGDLEGYYPVDLATGTILFNDPSLGVITLPITYRELAGFASADYYLTPAFDISLGGRYSHNDQTFREVGTGIFGGGVDFGQKSSENVFTYSADARWRPTDDLMIYGRVADGFVPGGPNAVGPTVSAAHSYASSTATNYEAGVKGRLLDGRLTAEVSAFDVEWRDIQVQAVVGGFNQFVNGGAARSKGVEWSFALVPMAGLSLGINGAYTDARLTEDTPASVNGRSGDRLPGVPHWETSASVDYEWSLTRACKGFAGLDWSYAGAREGNFSSVGPRQEMPSSSIVDVRAGVEAGRVRLTAYVRNLGDAHVVNFVQPLTLSGGFGEQSATIFTPRTFGVSVAARF